MTVINETAVSLRLVGDELQPDLVTAALRCEPSGSARKGEVWFDAKGRRHVARTGTWRRQAERRVPGDLEAQIEEMLSLLTEDLATWRQLTTEFRADMFCGLFVRHGNAGVSLQARTLLALGARGIELDFDVYCIPGEQAE